MFRFLKDESGSIIKLFVNQLGMTIFGLLMSFATVSNKTLLLVSSAFSCLFYFFLLYTAAWEIGARDKVKVDGGRAPKTPQKGFLLSLFANAPTIIIALLTILAYALASRFSLLWAAGAARALNFANHLLNGMYVGFTSMIKNELLRIAAFIALPLPAVLVTGIGYRFGSENFRLLPSSKSKQ